MHPICGQYAALTARIINICFSSLRKPVCAKVRPGQIKVVIYIGYVGDYWRSIWYQVRSNGANYTIMGPHWIKISIMCYRVCGQL